MGKLHPVDVHVGMRLRQRRTLLAMTQTSLGKAVNLTFQQIQKYERGSNRISCSRLFEFAAVLDVPVSYFFETLPPAAPAGNPTSRRGRRSLAGAGSPFDDGKDPLIKRETLELVRAYYKIAHSDVRKRIHEMVVAMGGNNPGETPGDDQVQKGQVQKGQVQKGQVQKGQVRKTVRR